MTTLQTVANYVNTFLKWVTAVKLPLRIRCCGLS